MKRLSLEGSGLSVTEWTKIMISSNVKLFVDTFLFDLYKIFYDTPPPRMPKEFRIFLQLGPKCQVDDWFLYPNYIVPRIYGFEERPYNLPKYLLPKVFTLEYARQRISYEFTRFFVKKREVTFTLPHEVMLFVLKNKYALDIVKRFLETPELEKVEAFPYDPHGVISIRAGECSSHNDHVLKASANQDDCDKPSIEAMIFEVNQTSREGEVAIAV